MAETRVEPAATAATRTQTMAARSLVGRWADARVGGGQYMPKAPRVIPPCGGVGMPIQRHRPPDEVRGYPGDIVAD